MKKTAPKKSKVTLDLLAGMVAGGFTEMREDMNTEFANVRKEMRDGFESVNVRVDLVDQKVTALRGEVISMSYDYKKVVARIENLELRAFGAVQE